MKRAAAYLVVVLFFSCGTNSAFFVIKDYGLEQRREASVGSSLFSWGWGQRSRHSTKDTASVFSVYYGIPSLGTKANGVYKELIYTGVMNNVAGFRYREYILTGDDLFAKESFFLDVSYDLNESKTVAFQDFVIDIAEANQQRLVFTVIEEPEFMNPAMPSRQPGCSTHIL